MNYINGGPTWDRTRDLSLISKDGRLPETKSLRKYLEPWQTAQYVKGIAKTTIYNYRQRIEYLLDNSPIPSEFDITNFLAAKKQAGCLSGTIANYVKSYRSFFRYLIDRNLYNLDPVRLKIPKIRYRERRVPSDEDVSKLFQAAIKDEDRLVLMLFVDCGIRVTELATIKLKNIDLSNANILINGKGGKDRIVYLSEATVRYLKEFVLGKAGEYLFPVSKTGTQSPFHDRRYFENRLCDLCKKANIEPITPHQLRHYFATHTLSNGADVKAVSEMLGHADVGITLKIYHHVDAKAVRRMHREYSPIARIIDSNSMVALQSVKSSSCNY